MILLTTLRLRIYLECEDDLDDAAVQCLIKHLGGELDREMNLLKKRLEDKYKVVCR